MSNTQVVTTGVQPLVIGSNEPLQQQAFLGGLPWNLTGGSAQLLLRDPNGTEHTYTASINAGGNAYYNWTAIGPAGGWTRAWSCTDASGFTQITPPIYFEVVASP
jgi:hypothetical protein